MPKPGTTLDADAQAAAATPVYEESLGGALIDSARISVMAALAMLPPPPEFARIVLPGDEEEGAMPCSAQECLEQAMQWLDAARNYAIAHAATPPTSLHVIAGGGAMREALIGSGVR